jgi:pyruvate formate lyase activating enzyme
MKEAMLYEPSGDDVVRCDLCAHHCEIQEGQRGICHVRENQEGVVKTLVYGRSISQHVDPVEKKPLLHFYPGSKAYSIATPGCNFRCPWCQNADISQMPRERQMIMGSEASPVEIVESAIDQGSKSIAYTYTEPTIFFEYAYETAKIAHERGLKNIFVTNGYMTKKMLRKIEPYLDAANVDLKGFRNDFYRKHVGAKLDPVLENLQRIKEMDIWLEVTTMIIPELNDSIEEVREAASFIARELGRETPWHISRFYPAYQMQNLTPTPQERLQEAYQVGKEEGLQHIYSRYVKQGNDTHCIACGEVLISRQGYMMNNNSITNKSLCPNCGAQVAGVGMNG